MEGLLRKTFRALGTVNTIIVPDTCSDALQKAAQRVLELDDRFSAFKEDSEISRINQAAGLNFVKVHSDTFGIIKSALRFSQLSEGTFDITARPLVELWGIGKKENWVPSPGEIAARKQLVDFRDIILDEKAESIMLRRPLQALDLGGIAKGLCSRRSPENFIGIRMQRCAHQSGWNSDYTGRSPHSWNSGPSKRSGDSHGKASDNELLTGRLRLI